MKYCRKNLCVEICICDGGVQHRMALRIKKMILINGVVYTYVASL